MAANSNYAPALRSLTDEERRFLLAYVENGNAEEAKRISGYSTGLLGNELLRRPYMAAALRVEVARQLAVDGARIGYGCLKRIAQDTKAPAAAQVAAAKALLQGAGLLEAPERPVESKALTEYSQEELRTYIEQKRVEIDRMEAAIADRARDIGSGQWGEPVDIYE